jgi:hypothetical protein
LKSGARSGIKLSAKRETTQGEETADGDIPTDSESATIRMKKMTIILYDKAGKEK